MKRQISLRSALSDKNLLDLGGDTWLAWRSLLQAAMGEELLPEELEHFIKLTGRAEPPHQRCSELWVVAGRRSGKSSAVAALAVYLGALCRWPMLSPGERAQVLIISTNRDTAGVILDYARAILNRSPILRQLVRRSDDEAIELSTGISIVVGTGAATLRRLRGFSSVAVVCDELAYWFDAEGRASTPDVEILAAARPTLLTTKGMLIGISAPHGKRGALYDTFRRHYGPDGAADVLVARGSSRDLNSTLSQESIDREYARDAAAAAAAYGAQFREDSEPPAPVETLTVVRTFVADQPTRFARPPQRAKPPRPRKAVKRHEEPSPPTPFFVVTGAPSPGYEGSVAEGHFIIVAGGKVQLTDAGGVPISEPRAVTRDPLFTARSLLREKINARQAGPYHGALKYPVLKY
jgi:hypothetical protein